MSRQVSEISLDDLFLNEIFWTDHLLPVGFTWSMARFAACYLSFQPLIFASCAWEVWEKALN